jgi:hypothetical protein
MPEMPKYILSLLLLCLALPAFSQEFQGGFFGGFSASQLDGDTYSGYNKAGLTAGAYFTRKINRDLFWKTEIRYIQKGSNKKITNSSPTIYRTSLHYAEVPLMLQYYKTRNLFFEGGLVPEVLLASKEEDETGILTEKPFHRFSVEGTAGAGYFLTKHLAGGIRFTYSLYPARAHASNQTYRLNLGQRNNVFSFSLYYHFR